MRSDILTPYAPKEYLPTRSQAKRKWNEDVHIKYIYIKKEEEEEEEEEERRCEMQESRSKPTSNIYIYIYKMEPRKATLGRKIKQIRSQDRSPHLREDKVIIELLA